MRKIVSILFAIAIGVVSVITSTAQTDDRVAEARKRAEPAVRAAFTAAGIAYPPSGLHIRAFKREGEVELWAPGAGGRWVKVATHAILTPSGLPGPKRKEGDLQVPEGFYEIDRFNPKSLFHLSLGINYPNAADRILGDRAQPGTDIFIHGSNVSIGCLPMGDDVIEQIYFAAMDTKNRPITVHIFPARMSGDAWQAWRGAEVAKQPALDAFWKQFQPAYDYFEKNRKLPKISVQPDGAYRVSRP